MKPVQILIKAKDEASGVFDALKGKLGVIGTAIAGYFGISFFTSAVKGASDLESKLSEVKAVSGATAEEMVLLRKAADDAGASTKFTATEGADALGNLTRAGLSAREAIAALPAVLQLAQAGGIGLAEASEYVTKTVSGLGLAFTDAGRVADVLAAGANASNTSVTGLAQALSYAAPVAKSLGLDLEFTVAVIGKFADAGIDASRAGTALNAILSQFKDPASKFRQELAAAGIITNDFQAALRQLAASGAAGQKAILAVGTEAGPALTALLNQGIGALDALKGKLDAAGGSAAATAAVMEDNLKGSFNGLSSAWDTVKNALATPVLPVLREGVTQLSAALQGAVNDGTIGRFGDAIATAFRSGLEWVRQFSAQVDFNALSARMVAFAARADEVFVQIGQYATNAGNIVQTAYGVMSAGINAVLTAIYGLGEAWARTGQGITAGLALIREGLATITFGDLSKRWAAQAQEARDQSGAFGAAADAMRAKAVASFEAMTTGAEMATRGWAGLTAGADQANAQAQTSTRVMGTLAATLKEVGGDATAVGQKAQAAAILQREAIESTRVAVAQLKTEYEAALAAGNVQLALEKLSQMQGALKATGAEAKKTAEQIAADTAFAFTQLGVTSQAELGKAAEQSKRYFETIRASAGTTAVDIANAFKAYAEKAIAANNGVATETLKTEASIRGVIIATDQAGKTTVQVADTVGNATSRMSDGWKGVGNAARQAGVDGVVSAKQLEAAAKQVAEINKRYAAPDGGSIVGDTREQRLAGQGSLDMSNQFNIREKLMNKSLSAADLPEAEAVLRQLDTNEATFRQLDKINPGGFSVEGMRDRQEWNSVRAQLASTIASLNSAAKGGTTTGGRTVTVRLQTADGTKDVPTTEAGAGALIDSLKNAKLRSA